jgi:hypothetical protein
MKTGAAISPDPQRAPSLAACRLRIELIEGAGPTPIACP